MSTLVSPGVSITVQNDSAYAAAGNGSVPLVVFASAQDKIVPGTTATVAAGTQKANSGKLYLMTSQRDVLQTFGMPIFQEEAGTVVQGDELNEYGLHGLFSALGITSRAYALRADIDLQELQPTQVEPRGEPLNQTVWFDTANSDLGLFRHNGGTAANRFLNWDKQTVLVPGVGQYDTTTGVPHADFGATGDYAFIAQSDTLTNTYFHRSELTDTWEAININYTTSLSAPAVGNEGHFWVKMDSPAGGLNVNLKRYAAGFWSELDVIQGESIMDIESKMTTVSAGQFAVIADNPYKIVYRGSDVKGTKVLPFNNDATNKLVFKYTQSGKMGVQEKEIVDLSQFAAADELTAAINSLGTSIKASFDGTDITLIGSDARSWQVELQETLSGVVNGTYTSESSAGNWIDATYEDGIESPTLVAEDGALWYDDSLYADILVNDGGRWQPFLGDVQFRQAEPTEASDGSTISEGDIWIDPADGTDYAFYQYQGDAVGYMLLDSTDQSTTKGILFADARQSDENGVSYFTHSALEAETALKSSNYVDPTCPDPRLYPANMLMVNLQQTGGVVRRMTADAFTDVAFDASGEFDVPGDADNGTSPLALNLTHARWTTASGTDLDGSALFGREAQRKLVVESMAAAIVGNETLRAETIEFNILAAPGYVEMLDELVTLNVDRRETAYIVTDVPARLAPDATSVNEWAQNMNNAPSNGSKGRTTGYDYAAQYMGWGLGTNVDGKEVCIPGSSIALRTYLYNDAVSYVWFPPAGQERGVVTNASSAGYITMEGEYEPVVYNRGQRDTMYLNKINPIALRPNSGLQVFGDKSLSPGASALDRVNVGRLVVYIRTELEKIAERFLFKLNVPRVRDEFAAAITAFLANLVQLEGLTDFVVVCDSSNNTPLRIDRNELWADVAIQPTKSINFVYVPIRIKNTEG